MFLHFNFSGEEKKLQNGRDQEEDAGDEDGEGYRHGQGRHL